MTASTTIAIDLIKQSSALQPRAKMDTGIIDEYTEAMKAGADFPPVTVFQVDRDLYLVDGYHRFLAAQGAKAPKILADIRTGTMREAILFSAGVNAKHGIRRNNEDKRRAISVLLKDKEWGKWADTKIADTCFVSVDLVADVRKTILGKTDRCRPEKRSVERAGKVFKMDTSKIGKKTNHAEVPPQHSPAEQWAAKEVHIPAGGQPAPVFRTGTGAPSSPYPIEQPLSRATHYPLLSKDEWYTATSDFLNGCLPVRYHRIIQEIREARPKDYPTPLDVIAKGLELAADTLLQDGA